MAGGATNTFGSTILEHDEHLMNMMKCKYGFDILVFSGSYGGHRQHTTDAGQRHGYGISSQQVS